MENGSCWLQTRLRFVMCGWSFCGKPCSYRGPADTLPPARGMISPDSCGGLSHGPESTHSQKRPAMGMMRNISMTCRERLIARVWRRGSRTVTSKRRRKRSNNWIVNAGRA